MCRCLAYGAPCTIGPRFSKYWPIGGEVVANPQLSVRTTHGNTLDDCLVYTEARGVSAFSYNFDNTECRTGNLNTYGEHVTRNTNITGFQYIRKYCKKVNNLENTCIAPNLESLFHSRGKCD